MISLFPLSPLFPLLLHPSPPHGNFKGTEEGGGKGRRAEEQNGDGGRERHVWDSTNLTWSSFQFQMILPWFMGQDVPSFV